jgi:hypothetical protein
MRQKLFYGYYALASCLVVIALSTDIKQLIENDNNLEPLYVFTQPVTQEKKNTADGKTTSDSEFDWLKDFDPDTIKQ